MFRKKINAAGHRFRFGLRPKMLIGLLLVFGLSIFLLNFILTRQLTVSMEEQIQSDLIKLRNHTEVYTRQVLLLQELPVNSDYELPEQVISDLLTELSESSGYPLAFYSPDEVLLSTSSPSLFTDTIFPTKAFAKSVATGSSIYELHYDNETYCTAQFIMPVRLFNDPIGYLYYYIDYSGLQAQHYATIQAVLRITVFIMLGTLLFSVLLLTHFITPLRRLTNLTSRFKEQGLTGEELQNQKEALSHALTRRHDEIGSLSLNYTQMLDTIHEQLMRIQEDRNHILELLSSRQTFFDNATHELKTPLTTIQGFAQLIQDDHATDPELLENGLDHILKESARLHTMVLQLLEMSNKKSVGKWQPLDLIPLLTSVAEAMELKANRYQSHLKVTCPEHLTIYGVEDRLRQLIINLIDNAIKYGAPHEAISISAGRQKKDESSPSVTYLCVQNKGQGLTSEQLKHIFEPFYRADKNYSREQGSSGLGLSICQKIAQEHGALIEADSTPGELTTFTVWFLNNNALSPQSGETYESST